MNAPIQTHPIAARGITNSGVAREPRAFSRPREEDALSTYLDRVGRHRLLRPEDEVTLATRLRASKAAWWSALLAEPSVLAMLSEGPLEGLEPGEWAGLVEQLLAAPDAEGRRSLAEALVDADPDMVVAERLLDALMHAAGHDEATLVCVRAAEASVRATKERFVAANLRLVVKVAMQHRHRGLPVSDLIQEGNLGLMKAVDRFDHRRGFRFSTYATWWIKSAMTRAVANHGRTIRVPSGVRQTCGRMARVSERLQAELGRPATTQELASALAESEASITRARSAMISLVSLDAPLGAEGRELVSDRLADEDALGFADGLDDHAELLRDALSSLSDLEAHILRTRFGLDGGGERTLRQIGDSQGLSRERIRQLEQRALAKLRRRLRNVVR